MSRVINSKIERQRKTELDEAVAELKGLPPTIKASRNAARFAIEVLRHAKKEQGNMHDYSGRYTGKLYLHAKDNKAKVAYTISPRSLITTNRSIGVISQNCSPEEYVLNEEEYKKHVKRYRESKGTVLEEDAMYRMRVAKLDLYGQRQTNVAHTNVAKQFQDPYKFSSPDALQKAYAQFGLTLARDAFAIGHVAATVGSSDRFPILSHQKLQNPVSVGQFEDFVGAWLPYIPEDNVRTLDLTPPTNFAILGKDLLIKNIYSPCCNQCYGY